MLETENKKLFKCYTCQTEYSTDFDYATIDAEKIKRQQDRYRAKKRAEFFSVVNMMSHISSIGLGTDCGASLDVVEDDAGLIKQNREEKKREEEEKHEAIMELRQYYNIVGRNDICLCGSGKKYKKCCSNRLQELAAKYRIQFNFR
jgi:hypothetical protein